MHWVLATTPEGVKIPVNLAAIPTMMRLGDATVLFLGGVGVLPHPDPTKPLIVEYARTLVRETPEQLLALPEVSRIVQQAAARQAIVADATRHAAKANPAAPAPAPERDTEAGGAQPGTAPAVPEDAYVADVPVTRKEGVPLLNGDYNKTVAELVDQHRGQRKAVREAKRLKR